MIKRLGYYLIFLAGIWLFPLQPVRAQNAPEVMLVYDSQNIAADRASSVTAVQQLLTSAGVRVQRQQMSTYKAGTLTAKHYAGVVTLINWASSAVMNPDFTRDRAAFTGTTLHIGGGLQADELARLQAKSTQLYRRQLTWQWPNIKGTHLLPYVTPMTVLSQTKSGAQNIGTLTIQGDNSRQYPYATIYQQAGFLPYFDANGPSVLMAAEVVANLFQPTAVSQAPLFTITNVTPYTDQKRLKQVAAYLADRNIRFAVSATSVAKNTELTAFQRYTAALRTVIADGGVLFLQMPVPGTSLAGATILRDDMLSTVTALAQQHVFPIGASTMTYWQNDALYRQQALKDFDTMIQLPDGPNPIYAKRDDHAAAYKTAYTSLSAPSLTTARYGTPVSASQLSAKLPMAVTFKMPTTEAEWTSFKARVAAFSGTWQDPATLTTSVDVEMLGLGFKHGQYLVNGQPATGTYHRPKSLRLRAVPKNWASRFFAAQGKVMWVFFGIAFAVMGIMLVLGRQVYLRMYQRKS